MKLDIRKHEYVHVHVHVYTIYMKLCLHIQTCVTPNTTGCVLVFGCDFLQNITFEGFDVIVALVIDEEDRGEGLVFCQFVLH